MLGPEAPLIAIGGGLGVLAVHLAAKDAPPQAATMMAAAGSFAAVSTLLGSPLVGAFLLMEASGIGGAMLGLVLVPYFTSFLIRVMSWQILLARGGPIEIVLNALHLHNGPLDVMDTQTAVFIGMVYAYLPIAVVPLYIVLERIPNTLVEASRDLGAPPWRTFVHIMLPLSRPGIATAVLLTGVPMLGELVIPGLLGGDRGVLMGQAISAQYLDSQNYALGSAMAVLVLIAVAIIVALLARLTRGFAEVSA